MEKVYEDLRLVLDKSKHELISSTAVNLTEESQRIAENIYTREKKEYNISGQKANQFYSNINSTLSHIDLNVRTVVEEYASTMKSILGQITQL